jgi:hypothetical protein
MTTDVVAQALEAAGDAAGTWLWRSVCAHLASGLRVGLVGRDEALLHRVSLHLGGGCEPVLVVVGAEAEPAFEVQDRLLALHAVLFVTPVTAPLGASERGWLATLTALGAPVERAVVVGDTELLAQMSDAPEQEAAEIAGRVAALTPPDWAVVEEGALPTRLAEWRARKPAIAAERKGAVGRLLLSDALRRAEGAVATARAEVARVQRGLSDEDARLDEAARRGARTSGHLLSAARRQTERLLVDLSSFLTTLERELPAQVDAVPDLDLVRRALPHWLHHVIETFLSERVVGWRGALEAELTELGVTDEDLARAELLVPAVHARIPPTTAGWGKRLGVTAAMGGGAALLVLGLWIPGLLAVSGGALFSALGRSAEEAAHRRGLVDAAVDAVRRMGADADRLLRDQLASLESSLRVLGDERRSAVAAERAAVRAELEEERAHRTQRLRALEATRDGLRGALGDP